MDGAVDDVADRLAGVARPFAAAYAVGKRPHVVEHGVNFRHDIHAINKDRLVARRAQRDVQHRAILRDVDLFTGEHRIPTRRESARFGQVHQQPYGLVRDAILRVIEIDSQVFNRHRRAALRVFGEQVTQVSAFDLLIMRCERLVCGKLGQRTHVCHFDYHPFT